MSTDEERYEAFARMDMPLLANHYAKRIGKKSGNSPSSVGVFGGGGKGGRPSINPNTNEGAEALAMAQAQFNNDNKFGYYNNQGRYVGFLEDATDGGGMNTTDTYFADGPLSNILNVAKVRPMGMARERDSQNKYIVPRAQIGYRDATDMTDGGGPQHFGGPKMGAGSVSAMANLVDYLGGVDQGVRTRYNYDTTANVMATPNQTLGAGTRPSVATSTLNGTPVNTAATVELANTAIEKGREPLYRASQTFNMTDRAAAIAALKARHGESWKRLVAEEPKEAEELIQEAMRMQNPLFPADP